eukprot:gene2308-2453_t
MSVVKSPRWSSTALQGLSKTDAEARANREVRRAGVADRIVELRQPLGLELDEDQNGNVFVKAIEPGSRAERSKTVFVGDYIRMVSATFGEDMWSCRGAGLTRVLSCIRVRNTKPVRLVLEAATAAEEKKRREIAYAEPSPEELAKQAVKEEELMAAMKEEDKQLLKKRKGFLGLW